MDYVSNEVLTTFIVDHSVLILILYFIFKSIFPNSQILNSLAEKISGTFPVFGNKKLQG
jgi:hypothetical protein